MFLYQVTSVGILTLSQSIVQSLFTSCDLVQLSLFSCTSRFLIWKCSKAVY